MVSEKACQTSSKFYWGPKFRTISEATQYVRLFNLKRTLWDLAGSLKRTKFRFKSLMGQISIMPIIRLVLVGIVLLSERILSENAVVGSWAQLHAVRSTIPRRKLKKVPYGTLRYSKKITHRTRAPSQEKKLCRGNNKKRKKIHHGVDKKHA